MSIQHTAYVNAAEFARILTGAKPFIVQLSADAQAGETMRLIEADGGEPTGREAEAEITFVQPGGKLGVTRGYDVLGLGLGVQVTAGDDPTVPPLAPWAFFAKGLCRTCGDFRRVNAENVCKPCHTGQPDALEGEAA